MSKIVFEPTHWYSKCKKYIIEKLDDIYLACDIVDISCSNFMKMKTKECTTLKEAMDWCEERETKRENNG